MKKLRLDLEGLAVESFDTEPASGDRGTVRGHAEYTVFCATPECTGPNGTSCNWSACHTCAGSCESDVTCPREECLA